MSLRKHRWGISRAQDRVWAQVNGLAWSDADSRLLMVLQAYVDDSRKDGLLVLAGFIASAEQWARFTIEWEELLPLARRGGKDWKFRFKMSEMAQSKEGLRDTAAFWRVIERNVAFAFSVAVNEWDVRRALARTVLVRPAVPVDWGTRSNTYFIAFQSLMDALHSFDWNQVTGGHYPAGVVDFIFDEQAEKKAILSAWSEYLDHPQRQPYRARYGATPRFEADDQFLPLQAADLWAWWVRKWTEDGTPEKIGGMDFDAWSMERQIPKITIVTSEDALAFAARQALREMLGPGTLVYDVRFNSERLTPVRY